MEFYMAKKVGIFYGSDTGHTEEAAQLMKELLGDDVADVFDVRSVADASVLLNYDLVILGTSTWYLGEMQGDMDQFKDKLADLDLQGRTFALFGLGDQIEYADYFIDGMGHLYHLLLEKGVKLIGAWPNNTYTFNSPLSLLEGDSTKFAGLALDEDNQSDLTPERVALWLDQIKGEAGIA